jgi:hypothetical protein
MCHGNVQQLDMLLLNAALGVLQKGSAVEKGKSVCANSGFSQEGVVAADWLTTELLKVASAALEMT